MKDMIKARIGESIAVKERILADDSLISVIEQLVEAVASVIASGGRILLCGNGGSASDALHIAGEIIGRFQKERSAWSAIVLNSDVATMTSIANDYGFNEVFARQVEAHMRPGDLFIGFSTSGNSENVLRATKKARELGGKTAVFTGGTGGKLKEGADFAIVIPDTVTARIQESHITIGHVLCELVEDRLVSGALK
jgi:D-sedoheptulose 7-phosphate isomerase